MLFRSPENEVQGDLFDKVDRKKHFTLMKTIDNFNDDNGREHIRLLAQGLSKKWHLKQEFKSRCFSTRIEDSIVVNCK